MRDFVAVLGLVLLAATLCGGPALARGTATAEVDRTTIRTGETFRLVVQSTSGQRPDFQVLKADFDVLSTSKSSQLTVVNGHMESRTRWIATLSPKRSGPLTIPAITVGDGTTSPLKVTVTEAGQGNGAAPEVFLEVEAEPREVYVQQKVRYTIRLFHAVEIQQGGLSPPKPADAVVERLGDDINYTSRRYGKSYQVTERRYAVFPQTSGEMVFPAVEFGGQVVDRAAGPGFGADPFARFFSQATTKPVRLRSKALAVTVKPKPAAVDKGWWLPADMVTLRQSWSPDDPPVFRVGEPVTRSLIVEARGLTGEQLPALEPSLPDGVKAYPDQPEVTTRRDGGALVGVRQERHALVATSPGRMTLPPLSVHWWDTRRGREQEAMLPATEILVLPAAAEAAGGMAASSAPPKRAAADTAEPAEPMAVPWWRRHAPAMALVFLSGWMGTAMAWWFKGRRSRPASAERQAAKQRLAGMRESRYRLKLACQEGDPAKAREALTAWAAARWADHRPTNLADMAQRLGSATLRQAVAELNQALYRSGTARWDGESLWRAFGSVSDSAGQQRSWRAQALPELYPSRYGQDQQSTS